MRLLIETNLKSFLNNFFHYYLLTVCFNLGKTESTYPAPEDLIPQFYIFCVRDC